MSDTPDYRDDLIDTQRKLIAAQEATIATLRMMLTACQRQVKGTQETTPRKDVQA